MKRNNCILVVDDDRAVRETLTARLEALCFDVKTAIDAADALNTLAQTNPRLIITDCDMGAGLSGLHLTKKIRQMGSETFPIVMFSGNDAAKEVFLGMAGGTAFFLKSEIDELMAFVLLQERYDFRITRAT